MHPGQEVLVQVYKDPLGSKGARLTTQFTIPSRYLVLTPGSKQINVSQRIVDETERQRLSSLIEPDDENGYIFRTAAVGAFLPEIETDKAFLKTVWSEVLKRAKNSKPGTIVYEEIPIVLRVLRDTAGYEVERIRVDHLDAAERMREFAAQYVPTLAKKIEYYAGDRPIF